MAERITRRVKWFSDQKGFGSITLVDGFKGLFVHQSSEGFCSLDKGETAEFHIEFNGNLTKAVDVTDPGGSALQGTSHGGRGGGSRASSYGGG
ncbi:glycine-rich protein 2-like [Rhodamnia argentea]|uniref:Glycine-rich protein 2-like n=1 Tax=Rhodamnia argentea TaxID=178133 RepID=A0ABM3HB61_9MYRT|nr:glycine-rich protein 2-like [Rhodamnia argentea]